MMKNKSHARLEWKEKIQRTSGLGYRRGERNFVKILVERYPNLGRIRKPKHCGNRINDELDLI